MGQGCLLSGLRAPTHRRGYWPGTYGNLFITKIAQDRSYRRSRPFVSGISFIFLGKKASTWVYFRIVIFFVDICPPPPPLIREHQP